MMYVFLKLWITEGLASFFFYFLSFLSIANSSTLAITSTVFGAVLGLVIFLFQNHRTGHCNPLVTLLTFQLGYLRWWEALTLVMAQCSGCVVSLAILEYTFPVEFQFYDGFRLIPRTEGKLTFFLEAVATLLFLMVLFHPSQRHWKPFLSGVACAICHLVLIPLTGCGINPVRTLIPALYVIEADQIAFYTCAQFLAGFFLFLLKLFLYLPV